jgi:two-component system cell cycle sensor histidine kinase/response regulator CckA
MTLNASPIVLVVDDDRTQVTLVTSVLQKAGFRVVSANSPLVTLAALEVAGEASGAISLLVTDVDMPGMSGVVLAAQLVAKHPDLKVLYLTGHSDALFQRTHVLKTHEAFLEKPVSANELQEAVNFLLLG